MASILQALDFPVAEPTLVVMLEFEVKGLDGEFPDELHPDHCLCIEPRSHRGERSSSVVDAYEPHQQLATHATTAKAVADAMRGFPFHVNGNSFSADVVPKIEKS